MIVTAIHELSQSKVQITIDDELTFPIYKGELRTYQIHEQEELAPEQYAQLMAALERRAKLRCMNLLKSRDYTSHQLRVKLRDGGYPDSITDTALAYVSSYGYVDDERYARTYVESQSRVKSRRQIENDLLRKGIDKQLVAAALEETKQTQENDTDEQLIRALLVKKHYQPDTVTYEERRKMIGFLYRKGFLLDTIYKVIGEIEL